MGRLRGKVAIITGAGTGLGRSAAVHFAEQGAKVVGCGRTAATLDETAKLIGGGDATMVTGDVAVAEDVRRIVEATQEAYGRVDVLVNNAAVLFSPREARAGSMGTLLEITESDWDEVVKVNLRSAFLMCRAVIPLMREQGGGAVLNVSSTAAYQGFPNSHHYSATKGGLAAFTKSLAVSYGAYNVRVNTLITGGFLSPGTADLLPLFEPLLNDPQMRYLWCPLGRLGTSEEIARTMAFLCSDDASYIHGADVPVDGGMSVNAVPNFGPRPPSPPLYPEDLLNAATAETGLTDFGDRGFVEGLTAFADALRTEARLSRLGHMMTSADIVRMLVNRLRYVRDLHRNPQIEEQVITKPIVVAGLPRTGTSKLQRMMSADPGVRRLDVWKLLNPAPFPAEPPGDPSARIGYAAGVERILATQFPDFMAAHPTEALEPDEELLLMEMTFSSMVSSLRTRVPSFRAFAETRGTDAVYDWTARMLRYLQWQEPDAGGPWIMKSPAHLGSFPKLLETFPDATVVACHRDPKVVIPSFARLLEAGRRMGSDDVDPHEVGTDTLDYWAEQMRRNLADREQVDPARIVDVHYERIRDDAAGVIGEVNARAGRTVTEQAAEAFAAYEARRPPGHFGRHEYTLERFGLTEARIEAAFAGYYERFFA
jgi:NAD(P)-dependent dehydrogenase (short-subunit alcohol dehydrogenase family)